MKNKHSQTPYKFDILCYFTLHFHHTFKTSSHFLHVNYYERVQNCKKREYTVQIFSYVLNPIDNNV
jgi:hypothetical protein